MTAPRQVMVFIASPGDLKAERVRLERVIIQLNEEFEGVASFRAYRWENSFYKANKTFQDQIPPPATCDVVIVVFGNRLGSELPPEFSERLPDGSPYPSGTAYELMSAVAAAEKNDGKPHVLVFRSNHLPSFRLDQRQQVEAAQREQDRLDAFFESYFRTPAGGFRRSFQRFEDTDDLAKQVDEALRQWAGLSLRTHPGWDIARDGSPFRGLQAFDAVHARVYFGRDRKVGRAIEELVRAPERERGRPFLLVVGPSGSGKSSLVRAGLVPRLTRGGLVNSVDLWRVAVMRPGGAATATAALAQALFVDGTGDSDPGGFGPALPELAHGSFRTSTQLANLFEESQKSAAAPVLTALDAASEVGKRAAGFTRDVRTDLLLVVDQLEEVFAAAITDQQRSAFANLLTALADTRRIWIVATLRADLYERMLDQKSPFLALKDTGGLYDLASPGAAELEEILARSAEAAGLRYEVRLSTGEALDKRLLLDAEGGDTLPLLQFALDQLFEACRAATPPEETTVELTFASYGDLGGIDGAIDRVAEQAVTGLSACMVGSEINKELARLLRHMATQVSGGREATMSQPGPTMRPMPMEEAIPTANARALVETLLAARLFVTVTGTGSKPVLRVAHEKVLTSWKRANQIVLDHREFYRIRDDIEQEFGRWAKIGLSRELPSWSGARQEAAQWLVATFGGELPEGQRQFVARILKRARWKQRRAVTAATVFAIVALIATAGGILAYAAQQQAARNYAAAKGAADQLVTSIAKDLRQQNNIPSGTLDIAFNAVEQLIDNIQAAVSAEDGAAARTLRDAYARAQAVLGGPPASDERSALERSRAVFLYEQAETYHQSAKDNAKARARALDCLSIAQRLQAAGDAAPELALQVAKADIELGDLDRIPVDNAARRRRPSDPPLDYSQARTEFEAALAIILPLHQRLPGDTDLAFQYMKVLADLGDIALRENKRDTAETHYSNERIVALTLYQKRPEDVDVLRELAWSFRKLGELRGDRDAALAAALFANEVCARRRVHDLRPDIALFARDLGFALSKLAGARQLVMPPDLAGALAALQETLHQRVETAMQNATQPYAFADFAAALDDLAKFHRGTGDATLADAYSSAAKDTRDRMNDLFPASSTPSALTQTERDRLRNGGPFAVLGESRPVIERLDVAFAATDLPRIRQEAEGCQDVLQRTVQAEVTGTR